MALNDYRCLSCKMISENYIDVPARCFNCGEHGFEVYFGNWSSIEFDARKDERTDAKGAIKQFGALDDPLCAANMGLTNDPKLTSYNRLNADQQSEFRGRLLKDGDSSKLRKDVLEAYNKATGNRFEVERD